EKGMAVLGEDTESVEAVLMSSFLAWSCRQTGDHGRWLALMERNARLLPLLPYTEELSQVYEQLIVLGWEKEDIDAIAAWVDAWEQAAAPFGDLRALGQIASHRAELIEATGNLRAALQRRRSAPALATMAGDPKYECWYSIY